METVLNGEIELKLKLKPIINNLSNKMRNSQIFPIFLGSRLKFHMNTNFPNILPKRRI